MPQNFIACDRDQPTLLPPDMREWLPSEHLAWFVIETASELELEPFYAAYRQDGHGRAAFDPEMMVALLLYAYASGTRSARAIERRCIEDIAYRVISAANQPDHSTIARFRERHQDALEGLFAQTLGLCSRAGLLDGELLALDSTKIAANASGQRNRTYEQIASEILAEAARTDAAEDELYGDRRGDELPDELRDPKRRRQWIREQLAREREEEAAVAEEQAPEPETECQQDPPDTRIARLERCKARLEAEHEAKTERQRERVADYELKVEALAPEGRRPMGRPPKPRPEPELPEGRINTTDPDSRPVKTHRGFIQGYNAQAAATAEQVIVACELVPSSADGGQLAPMTAEARSNLGAAGAPAPETVLADAGYWSKGQIAELAEQGIEALVPPEGHARTKPPPRAKRSGPYAEMRAKLRTKRGKDLYRRRQTIIEPVFAQIKVTRGIDRFQRRGLAACRSELRLIAATHNLLKLWRMAATPASG